MRRHYLVTGANGFVGRVLCRQLVAGGHSVRALLRRPAAGPWQDSVCCELGREPLPAALCDGIDGVFHLAGIAHVADISAIPEVVYRRVNVEGTRALLAEAAGAGVAGFVFFSSVKAVADPGEDCVDETWDAAPADAYGRTKREAEGLVLAAADRMHCTVLRPALVYGPAVKGNLRRMIDAVGAGRFPPVAEFGNRRSMVSVADLAAAARLAMQRPAAAGNLYLVADGQDYSTRSLYLAIRGALGLQVPRVAVPAWLLRVAGRAGDLAQVLMRRPAPVSTAVVQRLTGSACYRADRLRADLGWVPAETFYSALPDICGVRASAEDRSQ